MAAALSRVNDSNLRTVQAQSLQGPIELPDTDGFTVAGRSMEAPGVRDHRSIDPVNLQELNHVFGVKRVRTKATQAEADATP
jgi:hypothetical protein